VKFTIITGPRRCGKLTKARELAKKRSETWLVADLITSGLATVIELKPETTASMDYARICEILGKGAGQ